MVITCAGKSDQTVSKEIHCRKFGKDIGREFDSILVTVHKKILYIVWKENRCSKQNEIVIALNSDNRDKNNMRVY